MEEETVINCTCVPSTLFNQVGEPIFGNLEKYGWIVVCDLATGLDTATETNIMAVKGAGKEEVWKSIETFKKNYKMKYDHNSRIPKIRIMGT